MSKFCERCGKEHDGSYGSGRFCSKKCANSRKLSEEQIKKISFSLKEYYNGLEKVGRECKTCGKIFYSKDNSRKECFDCLPSTIKYVKIDKHAESILDLSKRTVGKVLKRLNLPCTCCGVHFDSVVFDIHHILPKKLGGTNDMSNLTYICPNCHRVAHSNPSLLSNELISLEKYFLDNDIDWKSVYYTKKN